MEVSILRVDVSKPEVFTDFLPRVEAENEGSFRLYVDDLGKVHNSNASIERPLLTMITFKIKVEAVAQTLGGEHTDIVLEVTPFQTESLLEKYE